MYYATELVKFKKYKKVLEEIFRKPEISISKIESTSAENPSLTGYAFEILFSICQLKRNNFEEAFQVEFDRAEENLKKLNSPIRPGNNCKNEKLFFAIQGKEKYNRILSIIKKLIGKKSASIIEQKSSFRYFELSYDLLRHPLLTMEMVRKTGIYPFSPYANIKRIIGFETESSVAYLKEIPKLFKDEVIAFYKTGECSKSFVRTILLFTQISHQFASPMVFDCLFPSKGYLKETTRQFQYFCKNHSLIKGKLRRTPNLDLLEIKARPDFLINKKLYEMKACKKFSMSEYLQALTYLIFAQQPENREIYGEVKSIILYYVLTNQKIEIRTKDLNLAENTWDKIVPAVQRYKSGKTRE